MRTFACLLLALALAAPAAGQNGLNFDIRSYHDDLIRVTYTPLGFDHVDDRAEVCFAVAGHLRAGKTFVLNHAPVFTYRGTDPGPVCRTVYTGFDYNSYDLGRNRRKNQGDRDNAFGRREISPQGSAAQLALYRDPGLADRVLIRTTGRLQEVLADIKQGRELMLPIHPGYKATLLWLAD